MFKSFVMFAAMRTGSNFLEANLNALPGVTCHGEAFNPVFIGKLNRTELFGIDIAARDTDPLALLTAMREGTEGLSGFRQFQDHDPRVTEAVLADPTCAKIILTRNPLEAYVSLLIARETGQWKLTHARKLRSSKVRFDPEGFERHLERMAGFYQGLIHVLQTTGQTAFHIDYEDLQDLDVLNGLAAFLGVEGRLTATDDKLKKQNPEPIAEKVENPQEMEAGLARIDHFNLSRIPNFEPRRGAAIPSFVASKVVPLLYMPVRGGPEARVTAWMDALGGVESGYDWRAFRRWRQANPGFRSFSVLRHPLARAHDGFCSQILTGKMPEMRRALIRSYGIALPEIGADHDIDAHRNAFLGFLRFLKLNLGGQTGLRVAGHFATQASVLQGMNEQRTMDLVLRESRMGAGLAYLADDLGFEAPALPAEENPAPFPLSGFVDDEVEAAAREAYKRDYDAYGFEDWREG